MIKSKINVSELLKNLTSFERHPKVKLVILKGNGKAFSAGGDAAAIFRFVAYGHWSFAASFYRKQLILDHLIASYDKPLVSIINGIVMGGGAGLSMHGRFRVVTENAVFAMPEASLGLYPDVGASHFLSRLPGFFEMELCRVNSANFAVISAILDVFAQRVSTREGSAYKSLDAINKCFSKNTIEEIFFALEQQAVKGDGWALAAFKSMKSASPTSLKIFLKSIRKGRKQDVSQCLIREFRMTCHAFRRTVNGDFYEGTRAILVEKDKKPQWQPSKLEQVTNEMVDQFFAKIEDDDWEELQLRGKSSPANFGLAKL
ncbi:hypothetical protein Sjap_004376 [Stephania japonica]|uniref:3-hydroxyisobutyryl-CoA hydrolase n=1 Tax=Stephania japonica TaxID=461633 RepID=A0AAP0PGZ1_9MAGN